MGTTRWLFVAVLGLVCFGARPAAAQMMPRSLEIDGFGGYYFYGGNLENLRNGPLMGARLGINIIEHIGVEASLGYVPTSTHHGNRVAHYLLPHFDLVVHVTPWRVVPFFAVGAGFQYYEITQNYRGGQAPSGDDLLRDPYIDAAEEARGSLSYRAKDIDFVFNAGGGVKFLVVDRFGFRIDGRYVLSLGPGGEDGVPAWEEVDGERTTIINDLFHHAELTGGVFVLLGGGARDKDGDDVPDRQDECPDSKEDFDDFEDLDGCPDRDNDGDGIDDPQDRCPDDAEDLDRFEDGDGCPEDDNDGDGLLDADDTCPDRAEDVDGFQDADGCPDPDNDEDGIPDDRDECPLEVEDIDGFRDKDGCPEPDNDGDGILDDADACPNAPEEFNGTFDSDGCPEADADSDGVYDGADRCPEAAEDLDGFEDGDGCPDPDNDADGLPDRQDMCPMTPEDADGYQDGDGCPDFDNDEDGIPDDKDTCPTREEDVDGFEDNDGCPDVDNDADGVQDEFDACPMHPETLNGFDDADGCPDELPEAIKKFTGRIPDINFKVNSDELLSTSFPTLNQAADALLDYPEIRMEVQGHASSDGDDDYNLQLSQKRAESVRRYLIGRGVDGGRLTAKGYGETVPVQSNDTEAGRRENRRVEFHIIQD